MSIFRDFFVKQQPLFTGITRGIGGFGFGKTAAGGGLSSSGGTSIDVGSDRYHVFTDTGSSNLVTDSPAIIEVMVCGAGGDSSTNPGAYASGGGAGGGGIMYADDATLIAGTHPISVGAPAPAGATGGPSTFTSASGWILTGLGGGKGSTPQTASPGGSSSGSGYDTATNNSTANQPGQTSNISTPYVNYGNKGGAGAAGGYGGCGGGGGAGAVGGTGLQADIVPTHGSGGPGGAGQPFPSFGTSNIGPALPAPTQPHVGTTGLYGGGGGGSCNANSGVSPNNRSAGGPGGGGSGARSGNAMGTPAVSYGGGGGGNELEGLNTTRTGFQGIVCVKIKNAN